jgi:hypothetical protein
MHVMKISSLMIKNSNITLNHQQNTKHFCMCKIYEVFEQYHQNSKIKLKIFQQIIRFEQCMVHIGSQIHKDVFFSLSSYFVNSQIWLNQLMDDHHHKNWGKKKTIKYHHNVRMSETVRIKVRLKLKITWWITLMFKNRNHIWNLQHKLWLLHDWSSDLIFCLLVVCRG